MNWRKRQCSWNTCNGKKGAKVTEVITGSAGDEFRLTPRSKYRMTNITSSWNYSPLTEQLSNMIQAHRFNPTSENQNAAQKGEDVKIKTFMLNCPYVLLNQTHISQRFDLCAVLCSSSRGSWKCHINLPKLFFLPPRISPHQPTQMNEPITRTIAAATVKGKFPSCIRRKSES